MNNYLNNTLTNLHLQDFLKEKGLDVSHMRYISDRQLAVDNLHMVPNMKDYLKSGYFILDGLAKAILSSKKPNWILPKECWNEAFLWKIFNSLLDFQKRNWKNYKLSF